MSPEIFADDNPKLTEIRSTRTTDVAILADIDLKCQETPLDKTAVAELMRMKGIHGILAIRKFQNSGFALFSVEDRGEAVFIHRWSVAQVFLNRGVAEKMCDTLRVTLDGGANAVLKTVVSENDIESPMFKKLTKDLGFRATEVLPRHFCEYSRAFGTDRMCDGIRLELV